MDICKMSLEEFLGDYELTCDVTDVAFAGPALEPFVDYDSANDLSGFPGYKMAQVGGIPGDIALLKDSSGKLELVGYYCGNAVHVIEEHRTGIKGLGTELIVAAIPFREPPTENEERSLTKAGLAALTAAYHEARKRNNC